MSLRKYSTAVVKLSSHHELKSFIRSYFGMPANVSLTSGMIDRNLCQADIVLALLRSDHRDARHYVELFLGHPISVAPPVSLRWTHNTQRPTVLRVSHPLDRRISYVCPGNPRQPQTDAYLRWRDVRPGRTLRELVTRGHKKRDLRHALKRGWIQVESAASNDR